MQAFLESTFLPVMRSVLDPLHAVMNGLPPWTWRLAIITCLIVGSLWVFLLSRQSVFAGSPSESRRCDLRWWVPVLLVPYVLIYLFL